MLTLIVRWSLSRPRLVALLAGLIVAYGLVTLSRARFDVFPDFVPPQVEVQTEAPGLSAEQVEQLITRPIEQAIAGGQGVEAVRSESIQGISVVTVIFADKVDPYRARQTVTDSLVEAGSALPAIARSPQVAPLTSSTMDLLKIGFTSEALSPEQLRSLIDTVVRPRLLATQGVARASVYGGEVSRIEVRMRPGDMARFNLTPSDLASAVAAATGVRGGGFVDTPSQRILITPQGQAQGPDDLARGVIRSVVGQRVTVGDVADVVEAFEPRLGEALIMGRPGVLVSLSSQYGANTLDATRAVDAALAELQPSLTAQRVSVNADLHRPANFINTALSGLREDLVLGAVLIAVVLFAFMGSVRTVIISFVSIPISLLSALIVMDLLGHTLDTMVLGGLAVALGVVVDDAVIDVENIVRRLRQKTSGSLAEVIQHASVEVRGPVVYATLVVALTLAPVLLLDGLQGRFFSPLASAFILATIASLLVAVIVTPALALLTLGGWTPVSEPVWLASLKARATRLIARGAGQGRVAIVVTCASAAAMLVAPFVFPSELLPTFREGHFVVGVSAVPGTSLEASRSLGRSLTTEFLAIDGVQTVEQQIGRAQGGEDTWGPEQSEFHIELKPHLSGAAQDRVEAGLHAALESHPGLETEVLTFLGDRIGESVTGEKAPVAVSVFGDDLGELDLASHAVARALEAIPGTGDVTRQTPPEAPAVRISPRVDQLGNAGLTVNDMLDVVSSAYLGTVATQLYRPDRAIDVTVILPPEQRADPTAIGQVMLRGAAGEVPLSSVADVGMGSQRTVVSREAGRRREVVTADPNPANVARVAREAKAAIASLRLPPGIVASVSSTADAAASARNQLVFNCAIAALAAVVLLILAFGDGRSVGLVLCCAPVALLGGILALPLAGGSLSLGALVGFVTLFGISSRNSILLVSHVDHVVRHEAREWSLHTLVKATEERVTPILMTALVTGLGLLPLALQNGEAGREIQGPMAIVILGGLLTSTAATLFMLPALIWRFRRT
ncbi:efflux RND transporter permease subunit [Brevundimonas sp. AJA228-03]|uniref:efflux RND transporter permease subunit n=1 Tax=Brevundimonas sp. AJA228-03 TaxID=2752515 RepID=UPI001ADFF8A2|nr:efflux RND transporter permease subunit [Brevundimonas sp. AJA228-03]QTN19874.1 efflux RND transporter permease subunit [Brevundimonas sp. AJA228-03]